jgi:hypothetical protein
MNDDSRDKRNILVIPHIASVHEGVEVSSRHVIQAHVPRKLPTVAWRDHASGGGSGGGTVVQGPGRVLTNVHVRPIFWGSAWYHALSPSVGDIMWAMETIFLGPYFSGLAQYGVGTGQLDPTPIFTGFSIEPPNPFSETDLRNMLGALIDGTLPGAAGSFNPAFDNQLLPVVFTPLDVHSTVGNANGFHNWMVHNGTKFPYAWVKNIGFLEFASAVYSHELAEACTDPFDDGVVGDDGSCGQPGGCEISDYCYGTQSGRGSGFMGGALVQAYWSIQDGGCFLPAEHRVAGQASGNPALIQGRFLSRGNFELLIPQATGGFAHYSRCNDEARLWWYGPEMFGQELGTIDALTMIQSNFTAGAHIGNLEAVVRWQGELLFFWREDVAPYRWHGPTLLNAVPGGSQLVTGSPSIIQSRFGVRGNFELVTPLASGGLAHYSRANDDPQLGWYGPTIFGENGGVFEAACLVQSNFSSSGTGPGNLEVVGHAGGLLLHYWRDDAPPYTWHGPDAIPMGGVIPTGTPSFIHEHHGALDYFQVVTPTAAGALAHYTRDNGAFGGLTWHGPTVFGDGYEGGPYDAVSLIQSNFTGGQYRGPYPSSGVGNLEIVARSKNVLFHFWRANNTQIAGVGDRRMWYGPWVVSY